MKKNILTLMLISVAFFSWSQMEKQNRWGIFIGAGIALPTGDFVKVNPAITIKNDDLNNGPPYFNGFSRHGNSAAKIGFGVNFSISYALFKHFDISASIGSTQNEVNVQPITDYMNLKLPRVSQDLSTTYENFILADPYRLFDASLSLQYRFRVKQWGFGLGPTFGRAWLAFPDYTWNVIYRSSSGSSIGTKADSGNKPTSNSLLVGAIANVRYHFGKRFFLEASGGYKVADFDYTIVLKQVGLGADMYSDKITYRVLSVNVNLGYRF